MLDKIRIYAIFKFITFITSIVIKIETGESITKCIILALTIACVLVLDYLIEITAKKNQFVQGTLLFAIIFCAVLDFNGLFLLIVILMTHFMDYFSKGIFFEEIVVVSLLLMLFILPQDTITAVIAVAFCIALFCARRLALRLSYYRGLLDEKKEELQELSKQVNANQRLIKTLKYTASLEERNRLAVRLHDKVGHGISGSIIMLEASILQLKHNPEKAEEGIRKAVYNLREGVDDIRLALREERPVESEIDLNTILVTMEKFEVSHHVKTMFKKSGTLDMIPRIVWKCIHENLKECLTNLLKHSNATVFTLEIKVVNKLLKVEYRDNGTGEKDFKKGIGLDSIEERTIKRNGRCFVEKNEFGFKITNTFIL